MAIKPAKGNYVTLEDVRITYDKKTDSIHLTSKDKDLPEGGFHLTLNKGREAEQALRTLLINAGMGKPKEEDTIPANLEFSIEEQTLGLTLGKGVDGKSVRWLPANFPHLFISGVVGQGKTHALHNLIHAGVVQNSLYDAGIINDHWEFYMTRDIPERLKKDYSGHISDAFFGNQEDSKQTRYMPGEIFDQNLDGVDTLLDACLDEIDSRYSGKYEGDYPRRMVIIDEASLLVQWQGDSGDIAKSKKEIWAKLKQIARIGRSAGVHLVIASQNPSLLDGALGYGIKSLFGVIAVGKQSKQSSIILTGNEDASLISDDVKGRCYAQGFGYTGEFQIYHYTKDAKEKMGEFLQNMSTLPPRSNKLPRKDTNNGD